MRKEMFLKFEKYMLSCMNDGAHDSQHIYRVLYYALIIAKEYNVDQDVLIAAALLHDIGRQAQYKDPQCDHAIVGAEMAGDYLQVMDWSENKACHVKACIATHRYRNNNPPVSMEAKILFDADKLDVTGTMGIARTLAYKGIVSEPLYSVDEYGNVLDGKENETPSFFQEYHWKLRNVYDKFFTNRAKEIAAKRRQASVDFYESMYHEVSLTHRNGLDLLKDALGED
jgi:uncharacterized protein